MIQENVLKVFKVSVFINLTSSKSSGVKVKCWCCLCKCSGTKVLRENNYLKFVAESIS